MNKEELEYKKKIVSEHILKLKLKAEELGQHYKSMKEDYNFWTQPIISGHSGSQSFKRFRDKVFKEKEEEFRINEIIAEKEKYLNHLINDEKELLLSTEERNKINLDNFNNKIKNIRDKLKIGSTVKSVHYGMVKIEKVNKRTISILPMYKSNYKYFNIPIEHIEEPGLNV